MGARLDVDHPLSIARVDQLSRNEDLQESLRSSRWDLIVVDEAHKLSANYYGNKVNKTKRFVASKVYLYVLFQVFAFQS